MSAASSSYRPAPSSGGHSGGYPPSYPAYNGGGYQQSSHCSSYHGRDMSGPMMNRKRPYEESDLTSGLKKPKMEELRPFKRSFYREMASTAERSKAECDSFLAANQITTVGKNLPKPVFSFEEAGFSDKVLQLLNTKKDFTAPTPIQSQAWPIVLSGHNFVGIAQTGSGKTLAFMLPCILHVLNQDPPRYGEGPIAVCMVPTRELAQQVEQVCNEFAAPCGLRTACIYGGAPRGAQVGMLRRAPHIIVGTPGRMIDFIKSGATSMSRVTFLVLDEADRMLDMGFEPQIRVIIEQMRPDRQTLMWSATWPKEVRKLAEEFLGTYSMINVGFMDLHASHNITQIIECVTDRDKEGRIVELMKHIRNEDAKVLIFVETKRGCDQLCYYLNRMGYHSIAIHGDKSQFDRDRTLGDFRSGRSKCLIATDVAARGLDVSDINYVINYDFPNSVEDYIHRIGRTGRHDRTGIATTFFTPDDGKHARQLISVLREASQHIPDRLYELAESSRGGGDNRRRGGGRGFGGGRGGRGGGRGFSRGFGGGGGGRYFNSPGGYGGGSQNGSFNGFTSSAGPAPSYSNGPARSSGGSYGPAIPPAAATNGYH